MKKWYFEKLTPFFYKKEQGLGKGEVIDYESNVRERNGLLFRGLLYKRTAAKRSGHEEPVQCAEFVCG